MTGIAIPKRNRIKTITGNINHDGGKIVIKAPTVGDQRHNQKHLKTFKDGSDEQELAANQWMADYVLDWDWIDDDGNPLPKPHRNPEVFIQITNDELKYIALCLGGMTPEDEADRKK